MSDMDSEKGLTNENIVPDLNSTQESEMSAVPEEAKTGKFCMTSYLDRNEWLSSY